jgi:hypothetical protein
MTSENPEPAWDDKPNDYVGLFFARSEEGEAVARVCSEKPGVEVREGITYIECRAKGRLSINFAEVGDEMGIEVDGYWLQTHMSSHYGRFIMNDDEFLLVADPRELVEEVG